jgi:hypothetical protein
MINNDIFVVLFGYKEKKHKITEERFPLQSVLGYIIRASTSVVAESIQSCSCEKRGGGS